MLQINALGKWVAIDSLLHCCCRDDRHEEAGYSIRGTGGDLDSAVMDLTGAATRQLPTHSSMSHLSSRGS